MAYELKIVENDYDWKIYHEIREKDLFEYYGLHGVYDKNLPAEYLKSNYSLLFLRNNIPIGTCRIDTNNKKEGILRLVVIKKNKRGLGYGRKLNSLIENYAKKRGFEKLLVNAKEEAADYYLKMGWRPYQWDKDELVGIAEGSIQMEKIL